MLSTVLKPRLPRVNDCCYTGNVIKCPDLRRLCAGYLFSNLYLVVQATARQQRAGAAEGPWRPWVAAGRLNGRQMFLNVANYRACEETNS